MSGTEENNTILHVENLSVTYRNRASNTIGHTPLHAVKNISFDIRRGECLAIFGQSGCGKSSIVHAILGLVKPIGGAIIFNNLDLSRISPPKMRRIRPLIQPVFQDYYNSLNPKIKIGNILSEALAMAGQEAGRNERLHEILKTVGIHPEILSRYPHQVSGGQKQRVALARALILKPRLLILDEPVSSQDVSIGTQIITLIKKLQQELAISFLLISHNFPVVSLLADRIAVMHGGQFIEQNTTDQIINNPSDQRTIDMIRASLRKE